MSQTFKDAIVVARKLRKAIGINYLWIDALCIIQDSDEDKQRECSLMSDIYCQSFLNLAACVGPDGNSGLFPPRDPLSLHTCRVTLGPQSRRIKGFFTVENGECFDTEVDQSVLASRGWVQQEFMLARRLLYFTPQELMWECSKLCAREKCPGEPFRGRIANRKKISFDDQRIWTQPAGSRERYLQIHRHWMLMVVSYCKCALTYGSDKLIAISAVAQQMYRGLEGRENYLCGLWSAEMQLHLLWQCHGVHRRPRPEYRAPSWSWAAVDSPIYNGWFTGPTDMNGKYSNMVTIQKVDVKYPNTEYIFGKVEYAVLHITGLLLKLEMEERSGRDRGFAHLNCRGKRLTNLSTEVVLDVLMPEKDQMTVC